MVFVVFCLTYFTQHNALKVHLCCCKWQNFHLFMAEQFPIVYIHQSSLFICLWTFRLLSYLGYCR